MTESGRSRDQNGRILAKSSRRLEQWEGEESLQSQASGQMRCDPKSVLLPTARFRLQKVT